VLVVSQTAAELFFPNEDPIGHRVRTGGSQSGPWRTIVGVVNDVNHQDLVVSAEPQMYVPQTQWADGGPVMIVKSASVPPSSLVASVREAIRGIDPAIPVYDVATMDERASRTMADRRFVMRLLGGFAAVALLLAAIGLYGVVSYTVTARMRELGVRVALGAGPAHILRPILTSGLTLVAIGLAAGVAAALVLLRSLRSLLVGVEAADPATFAGAVGILAIVAIAAHVVPARRALNVDPAIALRQE
jgi:putative ABC transport system permease protein